MIGVRLGPWLIDSELGRGGMGSVYHARRVAPGEGPGEAAVKVLAAELALEAGFRQRFEREITILRQLNHPHIVRFFESAEQAGRYFYVMEYVPGPTYEEVLEKAGRLPWREVLELALQVSPALKHAHDRGVIHRDLKPSNLLRAPLETSDREGPGLVKLADFGIASLFASPHLTVTGGVIGTPEYLSPEQASGKPVTPRSDLYSLGVVLYQLLTGRPPFEGDPAELLHKHRYGQFERLSRLVSDLPPDLEELIGLLLEKDPARRPPDAGVLTRRLDSIRRKMDRKAAEEAPTRLDPASAEEAGRPIRIGPATLMSRLMRRFLEEENRGGRVSRVLNQPFFLLAALLVTLGLIVWGVWPVSPEILYQRGAALMPSDDPEDWDRAWDRYLSRLEEKYPDHPHKEEVAGFRRRYDESRARRRAENAARQARPQSEAEWFYYQGLRLRRRGDEEGARRIWRALAEAYGDVPGDGAWARRAERELTASPPAPEEKDRQWQDLQDALRRISELQADGRAGDAGKLRQALKELYQGDEDARPFLKSAPAKGPRP